ncbi:kinase-like domain-containing protein [Podospora didyma]|uniref:non-specific serine/threonine protein kinase n=1 Tax=Podospora didyma TaxID=330526 RepID=A0AAE0KDY2_9PEZI|nr:kinase-like domain-containing protein [Podospora didyma]
MEENQKRVREKYPLYRYSETAFKDVEATEYYRTRRYHPVNSGDTFDDGRYFVHQKLGYGSYATVWIAGDVKSTIKVKKASASTENIEDDLEIQRMKEVETSHAENFPNGPRYFVHLLNCLTVVGPNGSHSCLMMELLGPSLDNVLQAFEYNKQTLRPATILRSSRQLLDAIDSAHQAGFFHGDISYSNVAFTCKTALWNDDDAELFTTMMNNDSPHLVEHPIWPGWKENTCEEIRLIDWADALPVGSAVTRLAQPRRMRAPESFSRDILDYRQDFWQAGCVIYALFFQVKPFSFRWSKGSTDLIQTQIKMLGPLPLAWHGNWEELRLENPIEPPYWNDDMPFSPSLLMTDNFEPRRRAIIDASEANSASEDWYYETDEHTEHDYEGLKCLLDVMKGLFKFDLEIRMSASKAISVIDDAWIDHRKAMMQEMDKIED